MSKTLRIDGLVHTSRIWPVRAMADHSGRAVRCPTVRVLICDDEPSIRELYRFAFEQAGAEVGEAGDGNECIDTARRDRPDVIVLDLFMPDRDGLSALP